MRDELLNKFSEVVADFLDKGTDMVIITFDQNLQIINCNHKFKTLTGCSIKGEQSSNLEDFLQEDSKNTLKLPEANSYCRQDIEFIKSSYLPFFTHCYIYNHNGQYILFGEQRHASDQEILNNISKLNDELSNKTRQLSKKNAELKRAKGRIEKLLRTDALTKLANRKAFMEFMDKVFAQAKRYEQKLTMVMIDLDKFKDINDNYGHQTGDRVLEKIGELLAENTRKADIAARLGGEEFAVLLTQTNEENALLFAERLRKKIEALSFDFDHSVTASFGVAEMLPDDKKDQLIRRADIAMYKAKDNGRNRVETL